MQTNMASKTSKIHIVHIVYSFRVGGLENGVVNLINHLPTDLYQHSIVCITSHDKDFIKRVKVDNFKIFDLHKKPGKGIAWLFSCWLLLIKLKPNIVHSRNLNALEAQLMAFLAGVRFRIHGEHGWDENDLGGINIKFQNIRKLLKPLIHQYVGLSLESVDYLKNVIGVPADLINHICNGVNTEAFGVNKNRKLLPAGFANQHSIVFGTVGRLATVKNQTFLVRAFLQYWQAKPELQCKLRLVIVGEGVLREELEAMVQEASAQNAVFFAGNSSNVNLLMQQMDIFVLPSLAEGISNTILEAMASGLPVIATKVGGNEELIIPELRTSHLVEVNNDHQLILAMKQYADSPEKISKNSELVRAYCVENFSLLSMVNKYEQIYQNNNNKGL